MVDTEVQMPDNEPIPAPAIQAPQASPIASLELAPAWHTVVLIIGILAISIAGSTGLTSQRHSSNRLITYAATAAMELLLFGWVLLGLWLRKVPFRTLFGTLTKGFRGIAEDVAFAAVFWMGSMMILGTIGLTWTVVEYAATHKGMPMHPGQPIEPSASQKQTIETIARLAPENGTEIAGWIAVCIFAGLIEEAVFRGYLQHQFTAWMRGSAAAGVIFSALMFGAAHGYQGLRNMVLLGVFGVLFSLLAIFRRSLRAGILAHSWHDLFVGLMLALLRSKHLL
jgi:membrane protease YdiL (CAAX protease family)